GNVQPLRKITHTPRVESRAQHAHQESNRTRGCRDGTGYLAAGRGCLDGGRTVAAGLSVSRGHGHGGLRCGRRGFDRATGCAAGLDSVAAYRTGTLERGALLRYRRRVPRSQRRIQGWRHRGRRNWTGLHVTRDHGKVRIVVVSVRAAGLHAARVENAPSGCGIGQAAVGRSCDTDLEVRRESAGRIWITVHFTYLPRLSFEVAHGGDHLR